VESYWDPERKQPRQRVLKFLGRVDDDGKIVVPPATRIGAVSASSPIGTLALFYAAARDLNMVSHIREVLHVDHDTAAHILCPALNQIGQRRTLTDIPAWVARSPIPRWEKLDMAKLNRDAFDNALHQLCHSTSDGGMEDVGLALQHHMTRVWRDGSREPAQFYYDVTRQLYYGNSCCYAEPGYFPGGTCKNVLGFGMVTSRHSQYPVLCRAIRGSRSDTLTVQDMTNHLKAWGFNHLTLILDRGMISRENVECVVDAGFELVGLVPETHKEAWSYLTHWTSQELEKPQHVVERASGAKVYVRAWRAPLMGRKNMRVALVLDLMRAARERLERDGLIHAAAITTKPGRLHEIRDELGALAIPAQGRKGFVIDTAAAAQDRLGDGRFLMFSTDATCEAEEMFRIYFQRDEIEKAFRTIKGELSLGPIRYRRRDRIDAYTTVVYLAYLLWSHVQKNLTEKYPSMTVTKAVALLEDIHLVRFQSGKQFSEWTTRCSKEQEKILNILGAKQLLPSG
jgi:hypothetical protein